MLAMIEFSYGAAGIIKKMSREDYARLREEVPQLNLGEWAEGKDEPPYFSVYGTFLVDLLTDGAAMARVGLPFTVKRFKGTYRYAAMTAPEVPGAQYHLHVAIPAIGLLAMDEVEVLEDVCTNELQRYLKKGWRIIAVCPPDAQRRPDYVLGRSPENRAAAGDE